MLSQSKSLAGKAWRRVTFVAAAVRLLAHQLRYEVLAGKAQTEGVGGWRCCSNLPTERVIDIHTYIGDPYMLAGRS